MTWHAALALAVVVALLFSLAFIVCLLWRRLRWRRISVFISYRAASDQKLVEQLFNRLLALNLRVWWDVKCLKPGQPWEDGFADGLFTSTVFVPVLSKAGLASFARLEAGSRCDNVLLEHLLALEQWERSKIRAIFPLFVGEAQDGTTGLSNFFATGGLPTCQAGVVVAAVDEKAREHLRRQTAREHLRRRGDAGARVPELLVADRTPGGILSQLCRHQGAFVQGEPDRALDNLAEIIKEMVLDVAQGKVITEAQQLDGHGRAPPRERRQANATNVATSRSAQPALTMQPIASGGREQSSRRPAPPQTSRNGRSAEQAEESGVEMITRYFAPPGVQIPEEERESVISPVMRHQATTKMATVQGALRKLVRVRALSQTSQHRRNLQAIDRYENVVSPRSAGQRSTDPEDVEAARTQRRDMRRDVRRDTETLTRLQRSSEVRAERVNQVIAHRRQHGSPLGVSSPMMGARI